MQMERGFRGKLDDYLSTGSPLLVRITTNGGAVYDSCCFGVDSADKLSDDRYMVFYNQPVTPGSEIKYTSQGCSAEYTVDLSALPEAISKLVFTVSIDGNGTMGQIESQTIELIQNGQTALSLTMHGSDFQSEKAIIGIEIYRKSVWRVSVVARGFNGGLADLLKFYGGELAAPDEQPSAPPVDAFTPPPAPPVDTFTPPPAPPVDTFTPPPAPPVDTFTPPPAPPVDTFTPPPAPPVDTFTPPPAPPADTFTPPPVIPAPAVSRDTAAEEQFTNRLMGRINQSHDKVNLEKHVVNLSKCVVDLSQKSGVDLGSTRAKVVVVLDYSGSMSGLYRNGTVQDTINRLVPLGLTFDDNGSIDLYLFQSTFLKLDDLDLGNYEHYVKNVIDRSSYPMGGTKYAPVLSAIIDGYKVRSKGLFGSTTVIPPIVDEGDPTFILFITDGDNADKEASNDVIRRSSEKNVFIQFIGIGKTSFKYLEELDDMPGRRHDNTGFSKMADLSAANDEELYTNVLEQFSKWLQGAQ